MDNEKQNQIAEKQQEIISLSARLSANTSDIGDWKIIKIYEAKLKGEDDPYDADALMKSRQEARDQINALQAEIKELEAE